MLFLFTGSPTLKHPCVLHVSRTWFCYWHLIAKSEFTYIRYTYNNTGIQSDKFAWITYQSNIAGLQVKCESAHTVLRSVMLSVRNCWKMYLSFLWTCTKLWYDQNKKYNLTCYIRWNMFVPTCCCFFTSTELCIRMVCECWITINTWKKIRKLVLSFISTHRCGLGWSKTDKARQTKIQLAFIQWVWSARLVHSPLSNK